MQKTKQIVKKVIEKTFDIEISISKSVKSLIINEAINFEKEVIFIAVPKTGTTSVRTQLSQVGTPIIKNPHLNICQIRDLIYVYLLKETLGSNRTFPDGNIPSDNALREKANNMFDSFFKFSAVRNPWARAASLYFRREGITLKDEMTFDEFCDKHIYASDTCSHPTLHINQYDWLCSKNGEILMDYIYKVEEFENAINDIKTLTNNRLILDNVKRNLNPKSKSSNYRSLYNDKTRKMIEKRFEKDIDYFKYVF
jgi:hypothetical protein